MVQPASQRLAAASSLADKDVSRRCARIGIGCRALGLGTIPCACPTHRQQACDATLAAASPATARLRCAPRLPRQRPKRARIRFALQCGVPAGRLPMDSRVEPQAGGAVSQSRSRPNGIKVQFSPGVVRTSLPGGQVALREPSRGVPVARLTPNVRCGRGIAGLDGQAPSSSS